MRSPELASLQEIGLQLWSQEVSTGGAGPLVAPRHAQRQHITHALYSSSIPWKEVVAAAQPGLEGAAEPGAATVTPAWASAGCGDARPGGQLHPAPAALQTLAPLAQELPVGLSCCLRVPAVSAVERALIVAVSGGGQCMGHGGHGTGRLVIAQNL